MNKAERLSRLLVCPDEEVALRRSQEPFALDHEKLNWDERVIVWGLNALDKRGHWRNMLDSFRKPSDRELLLLQQEMLSLRWHSEEGKKRPTSKLAYWGLNGFLNKNLGLHVEVNPDRYPDRGSTMTYINGQGISFPNPHYVFTPEKSERGIHQVMVYGNIVDLTVALQCREASFDDLARTCAKKVVCKPYRLTGENQYLYRLQVPLDTLEGDWILQVTKVPFEQAQAFLPPQQGVPQSV